MSAVRPGRVTCIPLSQVTPVITPCGHAAVKTLAVPNRTTERAFQPPQEEPSSWTLEWRTGHWARFILELDSGRIAEGSLTRRSAP